MVRCGADGVPCIVQLIQHVGRGLLKVRFFDGAEVIVPDLWQALVYSLTDEEFAQLEWELEEHWHKMRLFWHLSRGGAQA